MILSRSFSNPALSFTNNYAKFSHVHKLFLNAASLAAVDQSTSQTTPAVQNKTWN